MARFPDAFRALPLVAGAAGIAGVVANRVASGVRNPGSCKQMGSQPHAVGRARHGGQVCRHRRLPGPDRVFRSPVGALHGHAPACPPANLPRNSRLPLALAHPLSLAIWSPADRARGVCRLGAEPGRRAGHRHVGGACPDGPPVAEPEAQGAAAGGAGGRACGLLRARPAPAAAGGAAVVSARSATKYACCACASFMGRIAASS